MPTAIQFNEPICCNKRGTTQFTPWTPKLLYKDLTFNSTLDFKTCIGNGCGWLHFKEVSAYVASQTEISRMSQHALIRMSKMW